MYLMYSVMYSDVFCDVFWVKPGLSDGFSFPRSKVKPGFNRIHQNTSKYIMMYFDVF